MKSSADRQADRIPPSLKIMAGEFNLRATSWTRRLSSRLSPHRVRSPFKCSFPFEFSNDRRIECLIISPSGKLSRFTMRCFFPLLLTISIVEWSDSGSGHSNGLFGPSVRPSIHTFQVGFILRLTIGFQKMSFLSLASSCPAPIPFMVQKTQIHFRSQ